MMPPSFSSRGRDRPGRGSLRLLVALGSGLTVAALLLAVLDSAVPQPQGALARASDSEPAAAISTPGGPESAAGASAPAAPPAPATPRGGLVAALAVVKPSSPEMLRLDFYSPALGRTMNTFVYLPLGYRSSTQRYPVLYLLHGSGGSNTEWPGYGVTLRADELIEAHEIQPMIIVMPQGDQDYWFNHANGGPRWGDYVWQDLVSYVDSTYRTVPTAAKRAIGGLSMGAYGALILAIQHPDVFSIAGAHSPILPEDDGNLKDFFGDSSYFRRYDPFVLYPANRATAVRLKLWTDVSTGDPRLARVEAFHRLLADQDIAHQWHLWPGNHDGFYWGAHEKDYLHFYNAALGS